MNTQKTLLALCALEGRLFGGGVDPVGRTIRARDDEYQVAGVIDTWNPVPKMIVSTSNSRPSSVHTRNAMGQLELHLPLEGGVGNLHLPSLARILAAQDLHLKAPLEALGVGQLPVDVRQPGLDVGGIRFAGHGGVG